MKEWTENLKPLDLDALRPVFPGADRAKDAGVRLAADRTHWRHGTHSVKDARKAQHARQVIDRLPAPDEMLHIIMSGMADGWDYVARVVELIGRLDTLTLATLGYNRRSMDALLALIDGGVIGTATMLASVYFQAHEAELWGWLCAEFRSRNCRILASRNHCKLALFAAADGRRYAIESSANLRSCRMAEQMTLTRDDGLFDFHAAWIDEMFQNSKGS